MTLIPLIRSSTLLRASSNTKRGVMWNLTADLLCRCWRTFGRERWESNWADLYTAEYSELCVSVVLFTSCFQVIKACHGTCFDKHFLLSLQRSHRRTIPKQPLSPGTFVVGHSRLLVTGKPPTTLMLGLSRAANEVPSRGPQNSLLPRASLCWVNAHEAVS